jgi:hypothetical protein
LELLFDNTIDPVFRYEVMVLTGESMVMCASSKLVLIDWRPESLPVGCAKIGQDNWIFP